MVSVNIPAGWSEISAELYRWFLLTYGVSAAGRMIVEAYKQIAIVETAWYDVPTAAFTALEHGFIQHALLSFAAAEVINMVLGAMMKRKARTEGKAQGIAEGKELGIAQGKELGIAQGKELGIAQGKELGIAQGKERGIVEGKELGRAETNSQWRAWLQRKSEAEANGAAFTEPPPDAP